MAHRTGLLAFARVQSKQHKGSTIDDLVSFFQQFSTLLNSGTPLLHALRLCGDQSESLKLAKAIKDIANKVAGGESFYQAATAYPKIFQSHWLQMIRTGEVSSQLGPLMLQLNEDIQKTQAARNKVKGALTYPAIMLIVALLCLFVMLWKVIPTFAQFFEDFGGKLPEITQFVLGLSNFIQQRGLAILAGMGALTFAFKRYVSTPGGARQLISLLMALPVVGEIVVQQAMEKFCANLALLMKSGCPLLDSLKTAQESFSDNPVYYECVALVHASVSRGNSLTASMQATGLFTNMVLSVARIGEESGKVGETMATVAKYYQERVETLVERFCGMMEPMIILGMGVLVAAMLTSIYLPMFSMAGGVGGG